MNHDAAELQTRTDPVTTAMGLKSKEKLGSYWIAARAVAMFAAGCAPATTNSPDPDAGPHYPLVEIPDCVPLEAFQSTLAKVICAQKDGERIWYPDYRPQGGCEQVYNTDEDDSLLPRTTGVLVAFTTVGRLAYNCKEAATCLRELPALSWGSMQFAHALIAYTGSTLGPDQQKLPTACGNIFTGTLSTGQPCDDTAECATGLVCWGCPGVCSSPSPDGGPCSATVGCDRGRLCDGGTCRAPRHLTEGEKCGPAAPPHFGGSDLWQPTRCDPSLFCDGNPATNEYRCVSRDNLTPEGGSCAVIGCKHGACGEFGTCHRAPEGADCLEAGVACGDGAGCLWNGSHFACREHSTPGVQCGAATCGLDEYCRGFPSGQCTKLPTVGKSCCQFEAGECGHLLTEPLCYLSECDTPTGMCVPTKRDTPTCPAAIFQKFHGCLNSWIGSPCQDGSADDCVGGIWRRRNPACELKNP